MRLRRTRSRLRTRSFCLLGAAGCLAGALAGEPAVRLLLPPAPPPPLPAVDVVFVLDGSGSMQDEIDGVRRGFESFAAGFGRRKVDARIGMIVFRDRRAGEPLEILSFNGEPFTRSGASFRRAVGAVYAGGGGYSEEESSLDALAEACRLPFRPGAARALVLITDAPPLVPDRETESPADAVRILRKARVDQLHMVVTAADQPAYGALREAFPGETIALESTARGREGFERVLPRLGRSVAAAAPAFLETGAAPRRFDRLLLAAALWTALLALGLVLALVMGRNRRLGLPLLTPGQAAAAAAGGIAVGACAGALGQLLYAAASAPALQGIGRVAAWSLLGALVGRGIAALLPELDPARAAAAAGLGGALGALGFLAAAAALGDTPARLCGAALLGFCVGLLLTAVERLSGRAWAELDRFRLSRAASLRSARTGTSRLRTSRCGEAVPAWGARTWRVYRV